MKICIKCKIKKSTSEYYTKSTQCKRCHSNYYKKINYSKQGKPKQIREDLSNGNRICSRCRDEKPLDSYPKNKNCKNSRERTCKACVYSSRNTKEAKTRHAKLRREWYLKNRDMVLKKEKQRYKDNIEAKRAYGRQHLKDNPEIYKAARHRRRVRAKENGNNDLTACQIRELFLNACCAYCQSIDNLTIDHIIPISTGGQNTLGNVCVACSSCNNSKRARSLEEFIKERV